MNYQVPLLIESLYGTPVRLFLRLFQGYPGYHVAVADGRVSVDGIGETGSNPHVALAIDDLNFPRSTLRMPINNILAAERGAAKGEQEDG
jgi:hypothetical protein